MGSPHWVGVGLAAAGMAVGALAYSHLPCGEESFLDPDSSIED